MMKLKESMMDAAIKRLAQWPQMRFRWRRPILAAMVAVSRQDVGDGWSWMMGDLGRSQKRWRRHYWQLQLSGNLTRFSGRVTISHFAKHWHLWLAQQCLVGLMRSRGNGQSWPITAVAALSGNLKRSQLARCGLRAMGNLGQSQQWRRHQVISGNLGGRVVISHFAKYQNHYSPPPTVARMGSGLGTFARCSILQPMAVLHACSLQGGGA